MARFLRSAELTPIWIPDDDHEALRDLVARIQLKTKKRAKNRLRRFLLRLGIKLPEGIIIKTKMGVLSLVFLSGQLSERSIAGMISASDTSAVAVFSGPPKDYKACNGSLTIGDNVGWYGRNGTPGTITDINVIAQVSSQPSPFDHHGSDTVTAGWLYLDERGNYWVQRNRRAVSQISTETRAFFASLGLPDTTDSVATTGRHPPKVRSAHLQVQRCWSGGKDFLSAG